jgi:tetratricopeptide (TPR) repeat protein
MVRKKSTPADGYFREAKAQIARGDVRRGLSALLDALKEDPFHTDAIAAAAKAAGILGDSQGKKLFEELIADPENSRLLYETGYFLTGMGRLDTGRSFLEACLEGEPENRNVRYELGYSLFQSREYDGAIEHLAAVSGDLAPERGAAADLLRVECLLYSGRIDEGENLISRLGDHLVGLDIEDSLDALSTMAARLRTFGSERPASLREWHFVQHGGALLAESRSESTQGRFPSLVMNAAAVGAMIRLLRFFLKGVGIEPTAILHIEGEGTPLALAVGSILERPVRSMANRDGTGELLVIHDMEALRGQEGIVRDRKSIEHLFCFRIDPGRPAPIVPDVAGIMAGVFRLPWQERVEIAQKEGEDAVARSVPADTRSAEEIAREIADLGRRLPEDGKMAKIMKFYEKRRSLLLSTNREAFPLRRSFTVFSPI